MCHINRSCMAIYFDTAKICVNSCFCLFTIIERELGLHLFPILILVVELPNTNNWTN
jgi:hypothetical protein